MSIAMATEETGLPISVAAEKLGIHPRTLRRYISDGRLSAIRYTSQVVRIPQVEFDKFVADNIKVNTGTGTCYVPRQPEAAVAPKPAGRARPHLGGLRH